MKNWFIKLAHYWLFGRPPINQVQIGFVYQRGGLHEVVVALPPHVVAREAVQFRVNERGQPVEGGLIAVTPCD